MRRPRLIAEQARHASGLLGRFVAFVMAHETFAVNKRAIDGLDVQLNDHILDVGCGPGRGLAVLAARASKGRVVGADPSALMTEIAVERNQGLVKAHRVDVVIARADALPFADNAFDKALCVHVVYFWENLDASLQEIARVLKPGGRFALVFRTNADEAAVRSFPSEVYRFRCIPEVIAALTESGFAIDITDDDGTEPMLMIASKHGRSRGVS
ncbi:MAG: methyltransferase domain-containing protein [Alphaproteobacteria bacterium]|nr:methyltransferase domain-containing protein [Alphaproteobacteria bacterium]